MIPIRLQLSGFLSYRDPVELDFRSFDLACISGSNGAGKSSLLDAMTWALFGQARKRDDSLINAQCSDMEVTLEFGYEGNVYRVQRSKAKEKPTVLEFSIRQDGEDGPDGGAWKPLTERALRETEQRIEQILRMDYDTFTNASFFLQGKADQFAQQRPSERKRVLSSILGLEVWETYRDQTARQRQQLEVECASIEAQLKEINAELGEEATRKAKLAELENELERLVQLRTVQEGALEIMRREAASLAKQKEMVETLGRALQVTQANLASLSQRLKERRSEQESFAGLLGRAEQIEGAYQAWQEARVDLERWDGIAARFHEQEKIRQGPLLEIEGERSRLETERDSLLRRKLQIEHIRAEQQEQREQVQRLETAISGANERLTQRAEVEAGLRDLHQQQAEAKAENPRLKKEMEELKARIDQLEHSSGAECPVCGQPLEEAERAALIASLKAQGKDLGDRFRQNLALLKDFENRVRRVEDEIKTFSAAEGEIRTLNRQLEQVQARLGQDDRQVEEWAKDGASRLDEIEKRLAENHYALEAWGKLKLADAELKAMGYDAAAHDAVRRKEMEGRKAEIELRGLENARAALAPLEREIGGLDEQVSALESSAAGQQQDYEAARLNYETAAAQAPDFDRTERDLLKIREDENRLRMMVGSARQGVLVLNELRKRHTRLTERRNELNQQIGHHKTLERAFSKDGVPALLIEQALPEIESQANDILDRLSGGAMSVSFATQREYKDRKRDDLRETLDILISDGSGMRDYEMFSGGESFRVNFAIRLALSKVLAKRAGARLQTLVVDEGFGSQDTQGRQRLIEAINLVRPDFAKILVITHMEELKEAFPTRIEVEKTDRGSTVQVMG